MPLSAQQVSRILDHDMARPDSWTPGIQRIARTLHDPSRARRVHNAWRWLPLGSVRPRDGDQWQHAGVTLERGAGDCEDWAELLGAVLKALEVDARVGVMPGHAAVFVPLSRSPGAPGGAGGGPGIGGPPARDPHLMPREWPLRWHDDQQWLVLEPTLPAEERGLPGEGAGRVDPWLNTSELWIAGR